MENIILVGGLFVLAVVLVSLVFSIMKHRQKATSEEPVEHKSLVRGESNAINKEIPTTIEIKSDSNPKLPPLTFRRVEWDTKTKEQLEKAVSPLQQIIPNAALSSYAMSNAGYLFKATAPNTMKYIDGTFSSIIRNSNRKIIQHAGFNPVMTTKIFAPIIIFQVMSIVTGQYYLHGISRQLQEVLELINKLIQLHFAEKIGILKNGHKELEELARKKTYIREDLNCIQGIKGKAGDVKYQYKEMISNLDVDKLKSSNSKLSSSRVTDLNEMFDELYEELDQYSSMVQTAEFIECICKLLEFRVCMAIALIEKNNLFFSRAAENWSDIQNFLTSTENQEMTDLLMQVISTIDEVSEGIKGNILATNPEEIDKKKNHLKKQIRAFEKGLAEQNNIIKKSLREFETHANKERDFYMVMDEEGNFSSPFQIES